MKSHSSDGPADLVVVAVMLLAALTIGNPVLVLELLLGFVTLNAAGLLLLGVIVMPRPWVKPRDPQKETAPHFHHHYVGELASGAFSTSIRMKKKI
ncbi:MAG: hypothetical protein KW802_02065 [Candidatus Doudnabacteria bacterium]|nr:hypothetical protein [Candidatus Doudnabacteria bacterium]